VIAARFPQRGAPRHHRYREAGAIHLYDRWITGGRQWHRYSTSEWRPVMTTITDEHSFCVLNGVHLKKMANANEIASAVGVDPAIAKGVLGSAVANGLAMDMDGKYLLLPEGTEAVHSYYQNAYEAVRGNAHVVSWYDRFEIINEQFIKQVTEWQTTGGDEKAQEKLIKTVGRLVKSMQEIIPSIPRYDVYVRRFENSVALADRGEKDYICKPTIDSVHNIWFEFHEDILSVLGRPRDT
jgi:hypothetical protein